MTAAIHLETITAAIAALDVTGLTICDLDRMPEQVYEPTLFPEPVNFVTDLTVTPATYGADSSRALDLMYTLNYTFWYQPAESGYTLAAGYTKMVEMAVNILEALSSADLSASYCLEKTVSILGQFGAVVDPAGNPGKGCQIAIRVLEFIQG